jgi:two-component system, NarL family, sensor histidine kinase UhpB
VGKKPIRVLIVDDSEDDALLLMRELRRSGFDPSFERVDTAEAMNAALDRPIWDIVLSDYVMPRFDGLEAVVLLRHRGLDTPIMVISGKIGEETAVECMKAGASDYMMKDNLKRLGTAIERELREAENRRGQRISEERLKAIDANFRQVIASSADGIVIVTRDGIVRFVNPASEALFGRTAEEMVGTLFGFPLGEKTELEVLRDNGEKAIVEMRIVELDWEGSSAHLATLRDVTERKQAEARLRNLSHRLVTAQEKERRRLARELHDEVGQSLTALKIYLDRSSSARSTGDGPELGEAREALRELMAQVRSMSLDLRPSMLDDLGLLPTLLWHFKRYTAQTNVNVHFKHRGLRRHLPQDTITAAYRIVQEALTNVARYAQVTEVMVRVRVKDDALIMAVEDHGVGFDLDKVAPTSTGLNGMRERAVSLNGKLLVQSTVGEGTYVIAELPLAKERTKTDKEQRKR